MPLNNNRISSPFLLSFFIFSLPLCSLFSQEKLKKLLTKQQANKIRYLSSDGEFTYYQGHNGNLVLASNYETKEIIKGDQNHQYFITEESSFVSAQKNSSKKILLEIIPDFYTNSHALKNHQIHTLILGESLSTPLGEGIRGQIHLKGRYISYYRPSEKKIILHDSASNKKEYSIQLQNKINAYFTPSIVIPENNYLFYTDLNEKNQMGLLLFNLKDGKINPVYKTTISGKKIEICLLNNLLILGEFPLPGVDSDSSIFSLDIEKEKDFSLLKKIYHSEKADTGNLQCNSNLKEFYFIQNQSSEKKKSYELVRYDLQEEKVINLTNFEYTTNYFIMDGLVLVPFRQDYYIARGSYETKDISFSNKKK